MVLRRKADSCQSALSKYGLLTQGFTPAGCESLRSGPSPRIALRYVI